MESDNLSVLVGKMKSDGGETFDGLLAADIGLLHRFIALVTRGRLLLPREYGDFLRMTNGLYWNGLHLYGVVWAKPKQPELDDVESLTCSVWQYRNTPFVNRLLILGDSGDELIAYMENKFCTISRFDFRVYGRFGRLSDILKHYLQRGFHLGDQFFE